MIISVLDEFIQFKRKDDIDFKNRRQGAGATIKQMPRNNLIVKNYFPKISYLGFKIKIKLYEIF